MASSKRPTLGDIAERAGVSKMTVSLVLRGKTNHAGPTTRARIRDLARELGYRPNFAARRLAQKKTNLIGIVTGALVSSIHAMRVEAAVKQLLARGYEGLVWALDWSAEPAAHMCDVLLSNRVAGVLVVGGVDPADLQIEPLRQAGVPVVSLDTGDAFPGAGTDRFRAFYDLTSHLIRMGHRRLGYVGPDYPHPQFQARIDGIRAAVKQHGVGIPVRWIKEVSGNMGAGVEGAECFLGLRRRPTAVLCMSDLVALSFISHLRGAGVRVPQEVAVVGFDGLPETAYFSPALTTLAQPLDEIARSAVEVLARLMTDSFKEGCGYTQIAGELVIRESCGYSQWVAAREVSYGQAAASPILRP